MANNPEEKIAGMDPMQFSALLRSKRDRLAKLPPDTRDMVLGRLFRKFYGPKFAKMGVTGPDLKKAQAQWQAGIMGEKPQQLPGDFAQPTPQKPGLLETMKGIDLPIAKAIPPGVAGGFYGGLANLMRAYQGAAKVGPTVGVLPGMDMSPMLDRPRKALEKYWAEARQRGEESSPMGERMGEVIGTGPLLEVTGEAGAGAVPGLKGHPVLTRMLKGAAGGMVSSPVYGADKKTALGFGGLGAAFGLAGGTFDHFVERFGDKKTARVAQRAAKQVAKAEEEKALPVKTPDQHTAALDEIAQRKFGKKFNDITDLKQIQEVTDEVGQKAKEARKAKGKGKAKVEEKAEAPKGPPDLTTKEGRISKTPEASAWRKGEYTKARALGFKVTKGSEIYKAINEQGLSMDDVVNAAKMTTRMAVEDTPEAKAAISAVGKTSDVKLEPKAPAPAEPPAKAPEPIATKTEAGKPPIKVYAPGVSGETAERKQLLDTIEDLENRKDAAKTPMAKARIKKSIENARAALMGDKEAAEKLKRATTMAAKRAEAAAAKPAGEATGFEGGGAEEAPGRAVKVEEGKTPSVELIDSLKGVDLPIAKQAYQQLEGFRKSGKVDEEKLRALSEYAYRQIGKKLGIEDWDTLDLEDLYNRVTAIEGKTLPQAGLPAKGEP